MSVITFEYQPESGRGEQKSLKALADLFSANLRGFFTNYRVSWYNADDHSLGITTAFFDIVGTNHKMVLRNGECHVYFYDSNNTYLINYNWFDFYTGSAYSFVAYTNGADIVLTAILQSNSSVQGVFERYTKSNGEVLIPKAVPSAASNSGLYYSSDGAIQWERLETYFSRRSLSGKVPLRKILCFNSATVLADYEHEITNCSYAYTPNIGSPASYSTIALGSKTFFVLYKDTSNCRLFEFTQ